MASTMKRRKRRWKSRCQPSHDDSLQMDDIVNAGMDERLEDIATKTNLTAINVKSILHHILKDKRVLRMALNAAKGDKKNEQEKKDGESEDGVDDDKMEFSPKLTRSRLRQKVGTPYQSPVKQSVASRHLSPAKLESELYELLNTTLSDSSDEDVEYEPENVENAASDRESEASGYGVGTETGDEDSTSVQPESVESSRLHDSPDSVGDVRLTVEVDQSVDESKPEHKQEMKDVDVDCSTPCSPIAVVTGTHKEHQLCPVKEAHAVLADGAPSESDVISDMIPDMEVACGIHTEDMVQQQITDSEQQGLIADRTRSRHPLTETSLDDLEANFLAPDIPPDLYEWIENPGAEDIQWQQWLNDLMRTDKGDLLEDTDEDDPEYNAPQDGAEEEEEEYRTDMAVKVSYKELSSLLEEFIETYNLDVGGIDGGTETGFVQVPAAPENTNQVLELIANACVPVTDLVQEMESDNFMSSIQTEVLTSQLRQHIQLLCQTYLLSCSDPDFSHLNHQSREFLMEISCMQSRAVEEGRETVYDIPGIAEISSVLNNEELLQNTSAGSTVTVDRVRLLPPCAVHIIATALSSQSPLFPYLDLLPHTGLVVLSEQTPGDQRVKFTASEDNLMTLGVIHYDKQWSKIQSNLLSPKTIKQLQIRYKNLCSSRAPDNPVKRWKKKEELALVATPVYTPRTLSVSSEKIDVSSTVTLPKWLVTFYWKQMNQKKSSASTNGAGDDGDEPLLERLKRRKKGKKGEDGDVVFRRIAPAATVDSISLSETSVKAVVHGTAPDQHAQHSMSVCGLSGGSSQSGVAHSADRTTVAAVSSNVKEAANQTLQQILHDHSILVLPSVSDADHRPPPLTPVIADPNSTSTTTVGQTPISSTGASGLVRKPHSSSRAVTQRMLQEPDPKGSERAEQYAKWYLSEVQSSLRDHPDRYADFVRVLLSFKSGKLSVQEMYQGVLELLSDWPNLVRRFVGFLGPNDALAAGAVAEAMNFSQALEFLRKLEVYFRKAPNHLQKIVKAFRQFPGVEGHADEIRHKVLPLLKHKELIEDFNQFFNPKSLLERFPGSYEVIEMDSGSDFEVDEYEVIHLSSSSEKEEASSSVTGVRCKMCSKLVRRGNLTSPSNIFRSECSKQKRLVGSGKSTTIKYCCCKGRRRKRVKSKEVQRQQLTTASTADQKIQHFMSAKQLGEETCGRTQTGNGNAIDGFCQNVGKAEASPSTVIPSISSRSSTCNENCSAGPFTAVEQLQQTDVVSTETENKKDIIAGNAIDLEYAGEDGFMSDPVCMGEDTEEDTNAEQSNSPGSTQEAMSTDSEADDSIKTVVMQDHGQLLVGESNSAEVQGQGDKIPADNETVSKDGHILTWTKDEDRTILSTCQLRGLSQETFAYVSQLIGDKTAEQVEQRIGRLMELFLSSAAR